MSSKDSDADSCCRQGYDYDNDVIDMLRQNKESDSDSTKTGKKSTDSSVKSNRHQQYDDDNESENGDCAALSEGGSDYNSDSESESQPDSSSDSESESDAEDFDASTNNNNVMNSTKTKPRGRPVGSGMDNKFATFKKEAASKYKIICRYINEWPEVKSMGISKKQLFNNIVNDEIQDAGLESTFCFHYETALSRIRRKKLKGNGTSSPLTEIEPQFVQLVICMLKIKCSLTMTEGLHLCNKLIAGTEIQEKLIQFKISRNIYAESPEELGRVGRHYWKRFLRRNRQELRAKPGRKFAIDRSSWSTLMNFSDMYDHVEAVMVESNIAH